MTARLREGAQGAASASSTAASSWWSRRSRSRRSAAARSSARRRSSAARGKLPAAGAAHAIFLRRRMARGQCLSRATSSSPATSRRARHHHRAAPDHRGRARLAGRADRARTISCCARAEKLKRAHAIGTHADPVMLEVFNNLFMSIAEQMGVTLQNTAYSVNIKERLDFSCAVFDARRHAGRQRAAHAGASRLDGPLGRDHHPRQRGRHHARATSTPSTRPTTAARICPTSPCARRCSTTGSRTILFWVASRGHHADVGGISPGSMSPNATTIEQEGVLYRQFQAGRPRPLPREGADGGC